MRDLAVDLGSKGFELLSKLVAGIGAGHWQRGSPRQVNQHSASGSSI